MNFTKDSQLAKDFALLINSGRITIEDVPDLYNLKEVVQGALDTQTNTNTN